MGEEHVFSDDENDPDADNKTSCFAGISSFVLLIGLGAHSLFEGLAVGMAKDVEKAAIFMLAITMHKGAAGMSLGISFAKAFPDNEGLVIKLLFTFAVFTPIGVTLGWALNTENDLVEIIFSCLAAGTFLYIACSEVIIEEFSIPNNKWLKFLFFCLGIAIIASL